MFAGIDVDQVGVSARAHVDWRRGPGATSSLGAGVCGRVGDGGQRDELACVAAWPVSKLTLSLPNVRLGTSGVAPSLLLRDRHNGCGGDDDQCCRVTHQRVRRQVQLDHLVLECIHPRSGEGGRQSPCPRSIRCLQSLTVLDGFGTCSSLTVRVACRPVAPPRPVYREKLATPAWLGATVVRIFGFLHSGHCASLLSIPLVSGMTDQPDSGTTARRAGLTGFVLHMRPASPAGAALLAGRAPSSARARRPMRLRLSSDAG